MTRPLLLLDLESPREALFSPDDIATLEASFTLRERGDDSRDAFFDRHLPAARYVFGSPPLNRDALVRAPKLRAVFGYAALMPQDVAHEDCSRLGIRLLCPLPATARQRSESALASALAAIRTREQRSGTPARPLVTSRLGVLGWSAAVRSVAAAFGPLVAEVAIAADELPAHEAQESGVLALDRDAVLSRSHIVALAEPLTVRTRGSIGARELASLRDGALLLVLGRPDVVDRDALIAECATGRIHAAFELPFDLPLAETDPLHRAPNVTLVTLSSFTHPHALRRVGHAIVADLLRLEAERAPADCETISAHEVAEAIRAGREHDRPSAALN